MRQQAIVRQIIFCLALGALLFALGFFIPCSVLLAPCSSVQAQQPTKVPRIGYLAGASISAISPRIKAFRDGLHELGYVERKNIIIEWRSADEKRDRLPALATELVGLKVDVLVTAGAAVTRPVKQTTSTIPIVMTNEDDPVGTGFVASLARPGGNITGLSTFSPELSGKRLELLKETIPRLSRVAVFGTSTNPGFAQVLKEIELAAGALKVKLQYLEVLDAKDIEPAFQTANKGRADAVLVLPSGILIDQRAQSVKITLKNRLPAIYPNSLYMDAGGLMTYSASITDLDRRAATYVDKILKGVKPADIPVEQAKKFEFVINLKAARQIGLTIPPNVLARADQVVK